MKKVALIGSFLLFPIYCSGNSICPKNYLCSTNATVVKVKNVRKVEELWGLLNKPKRKEIVTRCDLVLVTYGGEKLVLSGDMNCHENSLNQKVTIYVKGNKAVEINWMPNPNLNPPSSEFPMPPFNLPR